MQIQTQKPYFQVDYFGIEGNFGIGSFPVTLSEIAVTMNKDEASLEFKIGINMMGDGFGGATKLRIVGGFEDTNNMQRWKYRKVELSEIEIQGSVSGVKLKGQLIIKEDDPVYGTGYFGSLAAEFKAGETDIKVAASAWFGKKDDFRYWYVDAFASIPKGTVPIGVTTSITGFGGGAYYRMSRGPAMGAPPSGTSYIPDGNAGLGVKALIAFTSISDKALNGKLSFEIAFNKNKSLKSIAFFGEAHSLKVSDLAIGGKFKDALNKVNKSTQQAEKSFSVKKLKESNPVEYTKQVYPPSPDMDYSTGIDMFMSMEINLNDGTFYANMEAYMNTPGGIIKGRGANGRMGWASMYIGSDGWYYYAGTPEDRLGISIGIGSARLSVGYYMMMGTQIPGSPPPPAQVADILGLELDKLDSMRSLNDLGNGKGFAYGMDLSLDTGDITFLVFYARIQAGIGFDIMLKNYGKAECKGSGPIGINGWYANGQAYIYAQGEIGINVKLLFIRKKIKILELGIAALLQAKLPNPSWFRGYVGGYYSILGGAIKGKCRFKLEIGEECELINGNPLGGMEMISEISPSDGSDNIDVFSVPQVSFNMPVNKMFEIEGDDGVKEYKIQVANVSLSQKGESAQIPNNYTINESKDALNINTFDVLPPNSEVEISITVNFKEKIGANWVTILQDGKVAEEVKTVVFATGDAPNYIPITNIKYCYPVIDQEFFYREEYKTAYIKLIKGQPYLFSPESEFTKKAFFVNQDKRIATNSMSYDKDNYQLNISIPELDKLKKYELLIVGVPKVKAEKKKSKTTYKAKQLDSENSVEMRNKSANVSTKDDAEIEVLTYSFATSEYKTFADKIKAKKYKNSYIMPVFSDVHMLVVDSKRSERFELMDFYGSRYTDNQPLIDHTATLDDKYYKNLIKDVVYKNYPLESDITFNRDVRDLGIVPTKSIDITSWYPSYLQSDMENSYELYIRFPYRYNMAMAYKKDYKAIESKIINKYTSNSSKDISMRRKYADIIQYIFPSIQKGDYKVKFQYILPGGDKGTSSVFKYYNPF
ncbi:MAG: hypothetical protein HRT66_00120 [Flavobacteriaceae bacterium]|nr:hypothetical protein [Flavobacteriaceae bacterium]